MRTKKPGPRGRLLKTGAAVLLGVAAAMTAMSQPPPQVANSGDSSHVFLNFSAGKSLVENHLTQQAYMKLIDPSGSKVNFVDWLRLAGFIKNNTDWNPNGQQTFTNIPGDYGPGKINGFAHIIILNAADLGFIRNQFIRCVPDCKSPNPKIYTYLENYGATQYLVVNPDGTPNRDTATTNTPEAVSIALERRSTDQRNGGRIADVAFEWAPAADGSNPGFNFGQIYPFVVQDHEPIPYTIAQDCNAAAHNVVDGLAPRDQGVEEAYNWPSDNGNNQGVWDCKFNGPPNGTRTATTSINPNRPDLIGYLNPIPPEPQISNHSFSAELDALGNKSSPGLCFVCHGGNIPSNLTTSGTGWPAHGYIKEFRYLPADTTNSIFGCNDTDTTNTNACNVNHFDKPAAVSALRPTLSPLVIDFGQAAIPSDASRAGQEIAVKKYNQAVLITQGAKPPKSAVFDSNGAISGGNWTFSTATDDQGITRPTHGVELILGWYADPNNLADVSMSSNHLNDHFVPLGWRGSVSSGPTQPNPAPQSYTNFLTGAAETALTPSDLYLRVVARNCRSCHMNRELSLDFGTEKQFVANQGNVQDYVFQPECDYQLGQVNPGNIVMPLARLTWERFWNGVDPATNKTLQINISAGINTSTPATDVNSQPNTLKAYFGQTPTSYCAHQN